jgi:hypothetical protein
MEAFREEPEWLVWFNDWSVWPSGERMHVFDRLRESYGDIRRLREAPAQVFEVGEIEDAISFVAIAVLFLWDCYVLTPKGKKVLFSLTTNMDARTSFSSCRQVARCKSQKICTNVPREKSHSMLSE